MAGIEGRGSNPGPLPLPRFSTFRNKSMLALHLFVWSRVVQSLIQDWTKKNSFHFPIQIFRGSKIFQWRGSVGTLPPSYPDRWDGARHHLPVLHPHCTSGWCPLCTRNSTDRPGRSQRLLTAVPWRVLLLAEPSGGVTKSFVRSTGFLECAAL